jgi:hypothetical protein
MTRKVYMTRKSVLLLLIMMVSALAPLYAGSTKLVSSWFAPEAKGVKFRKFLAVVATRSAGTRRAAEDELVNRLNERGNDAQPSYELLTEMELEDAASAKAKVAASGADGAVVLRLHTFNSRQKDQPSGTPSAPLTSEFTFFASHPAPGELTYTDLVVEIETLVYSLKDDKLLWKGVSRTKNPMGARIVVQEIAKEVINTMKKQGLIRK